jgi:hypothetical protein
VVAQHEAVDRGSAMARKTRLGEVREAVKGPAEVATNHGGAGPGQR